MTLRILLAVEDTMKTVFVTFLIFSLFLFIPEASFAGSKSSVMEEPGYRDADNDKINDLFRDADGNGINDVTGKAYHHNFEFVDEDGDGNNDLFRDANGDGVNDLAIIDQERKNQNITCFVIDFDGDGINDITGKPHSFEQTEKVFFVDEDGDGINDNVPGRNNMPGKGQTRQYDKFTDEDGDGINDGRGFRRELRESYSDKHGGRRRKGQKE
jgi:hypothetical protein